MKVGRFLLVAAIAALAVCGCRKHERPQRQEGGGQQGGGDGREQVQPFTTTQNTVWTIEYDGRSHLADGSVVDVISVSNVPANTMYIVSVINEANFDYYNNDLESFFKYELETELKDNGGEYIYKGSPEVINYGVLRSGIWYGFIIAIDSDNKVTGEFAYHMFEIPEEEPTEDYLKWLGNWTATDGKYTYNLTVSKEESNYMYVVDGWEVFPQAQEMMNQENIVTYFDSGDMYFVSQYIQSFEENNSTMEECFLGEIKNLGVYGDRGVLLDTEEGIDLACATLKTDDTATILPCNLTVVVDDAGHEYTGPCYSMKYFVWSSADKQWYHFNDDTIVFPIAMTRAQDNPAPTSAIARRGAVKPAKALRGKVYKERSGRTGTAVKSVRVK